MRDDSGDVRIDKWLWAARFFKTRSLAAEAVAGGKVKVNGERAKPGKAVRVGDALHIHRGSYEHVIRVLETSNRRGPATQAALLYAEDAQSKAAREALRARLVAERMHLPRTQGRPGKRERQQLIRFKRT